MPALKQPRMNLLEFTSPKRGPSVTTRLDAAQYRFPIRLKVDMLEIMQMRRNVCLVLFSLL